MKLENLFKEHGRLDLRKLEGNFYSRSLVEKQLNLFWTENPVFHQFVQQNAELETVRKWVYNYLTDYERKTLNNQFYLNMLDRNIARKCIDVMKSIFSKRSEDLTGYSLLHDLIKMGHHNTMQVSLSLIEELRHLFLGMKGNTGSRRQLLFVNQAENPDSRQAAVIRSNALNMVSAQIQQKMARYRCGLDEAVVIRRTLNRNRILAYFGGTKADWHDWTWQCRHVIRDAETLGKLIDLTPREYEAVRTAVRCKLPFGITPYYLSLMDKEPGRDFDHAVRAQVIPPLSYVEDMIDSRKRGADLDFMGEKDTSPLELVTRRYPMVAILKPYNSCAQICVYCQRNWEIDDVLAEEAKAPEKKLDAALNWLGANTSINEILVTGGDPAVMSDEITRKILDRLACMQHIRRIRIGTRVPVVLPMRITDRYADLLASLVEPGQREVVMMTHFEHPYEVTPESMEAVQRLKARGIPVYNQTVFTIENARRYEMACLRVALRKIGVDPYYTFNTKGKEETRAYRVPIARLVQEQVEEARLTPGLDRTDEGVFNIPRLGKSYLRAGQDHEVIMVLANGSRVYEFFPWDQNFADTKPYLYQDVPVLEFLGAICQRGENSEDYKTIWYYF